jgi:protein O-GlcNAc transferase
MNTKAGKVARMKQKAMGMVNAHQWLQAEKAYKKICKIAPMDAEIWCTLGAINGHLGNYTEGINNCRRALRLTPVYAQAHYNLGVLMLLLEKEDEAIACYRKAIQYKPDFVVAYNNIGVILEKQGDLESAMENYNLALQIHPNYPEAYNNKGMLFQRMGRREESMSSFRHALRLKPDYDIPHSNILFCLNEAETDPEVVFHEHQKWNNQHALSLARITAFPNTLDPDRRLRIGYISPDFRRHSVAYFFEPLLTYHDAATYETICYSDVSHPDAVTNRLESLACRWQPIHTLNHAQLVEKIHADGIDILVDLAGHTAGNRLLVFARKPAPIQVTYLGYPNTTGLTAIDYRLTDNWADPQGKTERWHSETLVRLPRGFLCYQPAADAPPVASLPSASSGNTTFGSFNAQRKVTAEVIALWTRILNAVPGSRLVLHNKALSDIHNCELLAARFAEQGISRGRLDLLGWLPSVTDHLALYRKIDIALDTFPYNGTTTTCEALWMGLPVITLAGHTHPGRVGVSLLTQIGLNDLIAINHDDYVDKAVHWASDTENLARLRGKLRKQMAASSLCDGYAFTKQVESAFRTMWKQWCVTKCT